MITTRSQLAACLAADLLHHGLARFTVVDCFLRDILRFQRRLRRIEHLHNRRKGTIVVSPLARIGGKVISQRSTKVLQLPFSAVFGADA